MVSVAAVGVGVAVEVAGCSVAVEVGVGSGASTMVAGPTTGVIGVVANSSPPGGRISSHSAKRLPAKSASSDPR